MNDKSDIFYSFDRLFSYSDALIYITLGERGCGKTFGAKVAAMKKFLNTGEQFVYLRRYKTELDSSLATFWSDLQSNGYFEDYDLRVKKSRLLTKFTCNGEVCGFAIPLSTSNIIKSTAFPNVSMIIFDEFLVEEGRSHRYLKREVELFLDVIESVGRLKDNLKVVLLGNSISVHSSPYFAYWNLELPYNSEFRTFHDGLIVVNYIKNLKYREVKKATKFGRLVENTEYGRYIIDNAILNENYDFIQKRPSNSEFYGVVILNGVGLGMWNGRDGYMYLSEKYDPNTLSKFVFDYNDHTEGTIFNNIRENMYMHMLIKGYKQGWLRFENQKVKSAAISILNKCIV